MHIELKRRGLQMKEAFNQINRYQTPFLQCEPTMRSIGSRSCWSSAMASTPSITLQQTAGQEFSFKQTNYWADE